MTYQLLKAGTTERAIQNSFAKLIRTLLGLALLTLSWDKNWDSHSLVNGYPSFYPRIALVAPSPGRPQTHEKSTAFERLCDHIYSSSECQYSISELESMLCDFVSDGDSYSTKYLKRKLQDHYGNKVTITNVPGKPCIFTFHEYSHKILHDRWYTDRCSSENDERKRVVETAARIIRQNIRAMVYDSSTYPEPKDITCTAPESLDTFIHNVIHHSSKTEHSPKHEAITQSIIAATRPRSFLSPLLLGIAVCIHRKYGSRIW